MILIAGPCVVESFDLLCEVAETILPLAQKHKFRFVFKSSYKKANRTDVSSFTGIGDDIALDFINRIGREYNVPVLTDVHSVEDVAIAAPCVDILQIPAFLCRQTELLQAAGHSGKTVNIKKGQFLSPQDMAAAAAKVTSAGNSSVWLTERGTFFGYRDLVVDFRSLGIMRQTGFPVIYDATHSVQQPGAAAGKSGGLPQFIRPLARAAVAYGIDGLFIETHPNPPDAKSDAATQYPLQGMAELLEELAAIKSVVH